MQSDTDEDPETDIESAVGSRLQLKVDRGIRRFLTAATTSAQFAHFKQLPFERLKQIYTRTLSSQMKSLLVTPLSRLSIKKLCALSIDSAAMHYQDHQGCYLLIARGTENDKQVVELYVGSSENMAIRYQKHVNLIERCGARMQHFHMRCLQLKDMEPLFIPLSHDSTCDNVTLRFRESMHIAFIGSWGRTLSVKNIQREAWRIVRNMRLPEKEERLPDGWRGANREIPFLATFARMS